MAPIEVNRVNVLRLVDEIIEDVAASGRDGEHPAFGSQGEGFEINPRVLPNLVVNETIEPEGEQSLRNAFGA